MDLYGEHDSAKAFFRWVNATLSKNRIAHVGHASDAGYIGNEQREWRERSVEHVRHSLRARWTLDGERDNSEWPNYQPDGYGAWLWALDEHIRRTGDLDLWEESREIAEYVVSCISQVWLMPSSDCWEENPEKVHTSTLACIGGGVEKIARRMCDEQGLALADTIKDYVLRHGVFNGRLAKFCSNERQGEQWPPEECTHAGPSIGDSVDASLLWAALPYGLFDVNNPLIVRTVSAIERSLVSEQGVHRYATDTYYGGGLWLIHTAWLGWYYCETADLEKALECLAWMEGQATEDYCLPEQVSRDLIDPTLYEPWVACWGLSANPLLWSHAMYLILHRALEARCREV
jgi:GH15 family glucan-1,4-alpha-glucosidase